MQPEDSPVSGRARLAYVQVRLRCVLPADRETGSFGIAFDLPGGGVMRVAIPRDDAAALAEALGGGHGGA